MATDNRVCKYCGKEFTVPYKSIKREYCSHKCANRATAKQRRKRVEFTCKVCGETFELTPSEVKVRGKETIKYCSNKCNGIDMRTGKYKKCKNCGKEFYTTRTEFCSRECVWEYRKKQNDGKGYWYANGYKILYNKGNPIKEQRKIMEEHLGRKLKENEVVHHKNEDIKDNRIENLEVMTMSEHSSYHRKKELENGKKLFGRE